jgi:hypothetical protein
MPGTIASSVAAVLTNLKRIRTPQETLQISDPDRKHKLGFDISL